MIEIEEKIQLLHRTLRDNKAYYKYMRNFQKISLLTNSRQLRYDKAKGSILQYLDLSKNSPFNLLYNSFAWEDTSEGDDYWRGIARSYLSSKYEICKKTVKER